MATPETGESLLLDNKRLFDLNLNQDNYWPKTNVNNRLNHELESLLSSAGLSYCIHVDVLAQTPVPFFIRFLYGHKVISYEVPKTALTRTRLLTSGFH